MNSLASFYEQSGIAYSTVLMLSTIVSLMVIPCSLISGAIAGKKIKYRSLAILSLVLALVGGIGPYFIRNFYCVFGVSRSGRCRHWLCQPSEQCSSQPSLPR